MIRIIGSSTTPLVKEAFRELFHDKFDLKTSSEILEKIKKNEIALSWFEIDKFSKLAEPILDHSTKNYSASPNIDKGMLDLVKTRLHKTKHRLICIRN